MGNCLKKSSGDDISLIRGSENTGHENGPMQIYQESTQQMFYPSSSSNFINSQHTVVVSTSAPPLSEEDQIKIAKRIGLVQHLPIGTYDGNSKKKARECVICMVEFCVDEAVRFLPCMHIYHVHCIDDWLMRSLTCPSCLEPVDAALLTSYET
ncbi:RING finger protein 11 [Drosophila busckii]|uniref:RING finger protein 11 n=1 Tax=Drosophila busckii TaxID=30019 RepID=UPI00083F044A|nr:RING finger protein 11 [Drosophila busckii]XP_017853699.1 RING finger protein 11 [Drosophila busckii]XP_017853700.1 RING finger protein 11 [Drosophila busckii]XP_017853701.1 RING finger protein 11 [Drosophila busckii]